MKFYFITHILLIFLKSLILIDLLGKSQSIKLEINSFNANLNTMSKKNIESNNLLTKNAFTKKNLLESKEQLEKIKSQILKNLNEFEKLNKIIIDFEDVETSGNFTVTNITREIDINQTDDLNDTVVINQNFCNLNKLKKNKIEKEKQKLNKMNKTMNNSNLNGTDNFNDTDFSRKITDINSSIKSNRNKTIKISSSMYNKNKTTSQDQDISNHNNSITSDDLLNLIADQTESIKNEICTNCLEINSALNVLIDEIKNIKMQLKKFTTEKLSKKDAYEKLSYCINNINLIKADLFKLNEILDTLQKANCNNFVDNSKKYTLVVNSTNKLVEIIQNVLRNLNININLVVLN